MDLVAILFLPQLIVIGFLIHWWWSKRKRQAEPNTPINQRTGYTKEYMWMGVASLLILVEPYISYKLSGEDDPNNYWAATYVVFAPIYIGLIIFMLYSFSKSTRVSSGRKPLPKQIINGVVVSLLVTFGAFVLYSVAALAYVAITGGVKPLGS